MTEPLSDSALGRLFLDARSRNAWRKEELPPSTWVDLYDLLKWGPTSANVSPARFVFCTGAESKARIAKHMSGTNAAKSVDAPAIVIVAYDLDFAEKMPQLFPHNPGAQHWFAEPRMRHETAFRNATLQGAYLIMAARALGFDCGPMSGYDQDGLDEDFFAGSNIKSNFLCTIGHGTDEPFDRLPRLAFDEVCKII